MDKLDVLGDYLVHQGYILEPSGKGTLCVRLSYGHHAYVTLPDFGRTFTVLGDDDSWDTSTMYGVRVIVDGLHAVQNDLDRAITVHEATARHRKCLRVLEYLDGRMNLKDHDVQDVLAKLSVAEWHTIFTGADCTPPSECTLDVVKLYVIEQGWTR